MLATALLLTAPYFFFVMNTVHKGLEKYLDLTAKTDLKYYIIYELFVIEVLPFLNGK